MSGHNLPITPAPAFTPLVFMQKWLLKFADNEYQNITEETFREFLLDLFGTFPNFAGLTVKQVKGATYPVSFTDSLYQIPAAYRILGMEAVARFGVDSATGQTGVNATPVYFHLIKYSGGDVDALLDEEPTTVATTKARWVQVSGTEEERIASFPVLELEDHNYQAGDVLQYTFPGGQTRLVQWKADSVGFTHPAPTGEDSDPVYRNFAPLGDAAAGGGISGATVPVLYDAGTRIVSIQVAGAGQAGALSAADWSTFNSKQASLSGSATVGMTANVLSVKDASIGDAQQATAVRTGLLATLATLFGTAATGFTRFTDYIGYLYTQLTAHNPAFATLAVVVGSPNTATVTAANKYVCNSILPLTLASTTLAVPTTNVPNGATGLIKVVQDGTGGRALVLPPASSTHLGTAEVSIKTSANAITDLSWLYDGAAFHWVSKQY